MNQINLGRHQLNLDDEYVLHSATFMGSTDNAAVVVVEADEEKQELLFRPNVVITPTEDHVPADKFQAYVAAQIDSLKASVKNFKHIGTETVQCADGSTGVLQRHTFDSPNNVMVEQLQLYRAQGEQTAIITATHLAGEPFDDSEPAFRKMMLSLAWT